jgi:tape measure domain-containing protein
MAIVLKTISDSKAARDDLAKLRSAVTGIESTVNSTRDSFIKMGASLAAVFGAVAVAKGVTDQLDTFTNLSNKIKLATDTTADFNKAQERTRQIAISSRSSLQAVTALYSRVSMASKDLGISQTKVLRVTDLVSKSLQISGATANESAAALQQFGQAIASGKLSGDEFRSITENAPTLAMALAKSFKASIGELRDMSQNGELLSGKVLQGILDQGENIDKQFGRVSITYEKAFSNIGNAVGILANTSFNALFTSTSSFADKINDVAVSIFNFAEDFDLNMLRVKTSAVDIYVQIFEVFYKFQDILKETSLDTDTFVSSLTTAFPSVLSSLSRYTLEFSDILVKNIKSGFTIVKESLYTLFDKMNITLPRIDVMSFIPNLDKALSVVKHWATKIEGWFFWVYDRVIGHSWVPDLVNGVIDWTRKLLNRPLSFIEQFASKSNDAFRGLEIGGGWIASLSAGFLVVKQFREEFGFLMFAIKTTLGGLAGLGILELFRTGKLDLKLSQTPSDKLTSIWDRLTASVIQLKNSLNKMLSSNVFVRTFKQMFGMQDTAGGKLFGETIDPNSQVGRGPHRSSLERPFGHDVINALPSGLQVPALGAVTGIIGLAIVKAFGSGGVSAVLLSVLTTVFTLVMNNTVYKATMNKTFGDAAFFFVNIVEKGISGLFGGNILKDWVGGLTIIAKSLLLFEGARKVAFEGFLTALKAPTNAALDLGKMWDRSTLRKGIEKANIQLADLPTRLQKVNAKNQEVYQTALSQLSDMKTSAAGRIGPAAALQAVVADKGGAFPNQAANQALSVAMAARNATLKSQADLKGIGTITAKLTASRDELLAHEQKLTEGFKETTAAFKQGVKTLGASAGGALGGVAGYQLGVEIAKGLTEASGWQKIAIVLGTAIAGDAIGSMIGLTLSTILLSTLGLIGAGIAAAFAAAPILIPLAIGAALYAGYQLFEALPEQWKVGLSDYLTQLIDAAKQSVGADVSGSWQAATWDALASAIKWIGEQLSILGVKWIERFTQIVNLFDNATVIFKSFLGVLSGISTIVSSLYNEMNNASMKGTKGPSQERVGGYKQVSDSLAPLSVYTRASGGIVTGSGTGTSDSIPALISNGEFVVNTEATKKNRRLLEAINTGTIAKFAKGTPSIMDSMSFTNYGGVSNKPIQVEIIKQLPNKPEENFFTGLLDKLKGLTGITTKGLDGVADKMLGHGAGITISPTSIDKLAASLQGAGFKNVSIKDVAGFGQYSGKIEEALAHITELTAKGESLPKDSSPAKAEFALAAQWREQLTSLIGKAKEGGIDTSRIKEIGGEDKKKKAKKIKDETLQVKDQFTIINEAFPELALSLKEFYGMSDDLRTSIYASASKINIESKKIDDIKIGLPGEEHAVAIKKQRDTLEKSRAEAQTQAKVQVAPMRTPFESSKALFAEIGANISQDSFVLLSEAQLQMVTSLGEGAQKAMKIVTAPLGNSAITAKARAESQKYVNRQLEKVNEIIAQAVISASNSYMSLSGDLSSFGISLDKGIYNKLTDATRGTLIEITKRLKEAELKTKSSDENTRIAGQNAIEALQAQFDKIVLTASRSLSKDIEAAGQTFADTITNSFKDGLKSLAKGDQSFKDFAMSQLDTYTNSVIDTFIEGLTKPFQTSGTDLLGNIGSSLFAQANSIFGGADAATAAKDANSKLGGMFGGGVGLPTSSDPNTQALISADTANTDRLIAAISGTGMGGGAISSMFGGKDGGIGANGIPNLLGRKDGGLNAEGVPNLLAKPDPSMFSGIGDSMTKMFGGLFGDGGSISSIFEGFGGGLTSMFGGLLDGIMGMFGGGGGGGDIMGSVMGIGKSIMGFFADGGVAGRISGSGTGTSDSIPAMLSNGEFVVNAKATKDNIKLLSAINSGSIRKLASGGLADNMPQMNIPSLSNPEMRMIPSTIDMSKAGTGQNTSNQVINLSFTGDISRQTKAEVYKMLPTIAQGVNIHNKEKGYRG